MDVLSAIRQRLTELGLEQKDLARAARVTESYVSQLLSRKKAPPAPNRTDIYEKMDKVLKLPRGELARLAEAQRKAELQESLGDGPGALYADVRDLILQKCVPSKAAEVRTIFQRQPFGELERLVTQKLLDLAKRVARAELENPAWIAGVAERAGKSYEEMRVMVLEFLDTEILDLSRESCVSFLDPLITSWDIDLATFELEVVLDERATTDRVRRFVITEGEPEPPAEEPGFIEFVADKSLSGTASPDELAFLRRIRFGTRRPTALYFYRELQSLRDPLHFRTG